MSTNISVSCVKTIAVAALTLAMVGIAGTPGRDASAQVPFFAPLGDDQNIHPTQSKADRFDLVLATQRLLYALGYAVGDIDGILSEETAAAIRTFQRLNFMRVDGEVGDSLVIFLSLHAVDRMEEGDREDIIEASSDEDEDFDPLSRPVVALVQRMLTRTGFSPGRVDGVYSRGTGQAIRNFQARAELDITGTIDSELLGALSDFEDTVVGG